MEKTIQFRLEDFEGPLDLLLALLAKNKMSIYDIEIVTLIDQYLEVVGEPGLYGMETASEFIGMAARLVQMKSTLLLPKSEEAERMREELTGLLVEYSACKLVAGQLKEMGEGVFITVRNPLEMEFDTTYTGTHNPQELAVAFASIMGRSNARRVPRQEQFEEIVAAPFVSVSGKVIHVLRGLVTGKIRWLQQVFRGSSSRSETVATFLALLELIRGGRIESNDGEEITLQKNGGKRQIAKEREEASGS